MPVETMSHFAGPVGVGFAVILAALTGFCVFACAFILSIKAYGWEVPLRTRLPVMGLGIVTIWRAWTIYDTQIIVISAIISWACWAFVTFVVMMELIVQSWIRWQQHQDLNTLDKEILSHVPQYEVDKIKGAARDAGVLEEPKK